MPKTSTPDRWYGTGVTLTTQEHELVMNLFPKTAEDNEAFFASVLELALKYKLPNITPSQYAYDGSQIVFDSNPIEEFLNSRLGFEIEDWLRVIGSFNKSTMGAKKRAMGFYWITKLKPRLEEEEDYNLICHWWLYRDPRWQAWRKKVKRLRA